MESRTCLGNLVSFQLTNNLQSEIYNLQFNQDMGLLNFISKSRILKNIGKKRDDGESFLKLLNMVVNTGHQAEFKLPPQLLQLLPIAARLFLRGFINSLYFQQNLDWVLPFFAEKQFNPQTADFTARGHLPILLNCTHRNWTATGIIGSRNESIIDPRNLITPIRDGSSIDLWIKDGDKIYFPSKLDSISQTINENFPLITTSFTTEGLELSVKIFATKIGENEFLIANTKISNISSQRRSSTLYLAVRPYNPEGICPINEIQFKEKYISINGKLGVIFISAPDRVDCANESEGDIALRIPHLKNNKIIKCEKGLCSGVAEYNKEINPGDEVSQTFVVPTQNLKPENKLIEKIYLLNENDELKKFKENWEWEIEKTIKITIPDATMQTAFNTGKVHLLLLWDGDEITQGPFTYHHFCLRDAAYQISALDKIGLHSKAEKILLTYPKRQQRNDGYFIAQDGEWDSNGQAIWTICQHFLYTRSEEFLRNLYPSIRKGIVWIERKRRTTKSDSKNPYFGLLPTGLSAERLGLPDFYYWDSFWGLAGMRDASLIAEILGFKNDHARIKEYFVNFKSNIDKSLNYVSGKLGRNVIPASPYRRMDSGAIGSICALYPLRLLNPWDERIINTLDEIKKISFHQNGFFQHIVHSGINAYLTLQYAECLLFQRKETAYELIENILSMATSTYTWPEAIHPITKGGVMGDGLHGWANAEFLHIIRNLLFFEEDEKLVVLSSIPKQWTTEGKVIKVDNAPSYFGNINFSAEFEKGRAFLNFENKWTSEPPKEIEINLPINIRKLLVDGEEKPVIDNRKITLQGDAKNVELVVEN